MSTAGPKDRPLYTAVIRGMVAIAVLGVLVVGCGGNSEPVRTTRRFFEGLAADDEAVAELICSGNQLGSALGLLGLSMSFWGADQIMFQDMSYELIGQDESMAKVHVSGTIVALYDLGGDREQQSQPFEQIIVLKKEAGQWCVNLSPW